MCVIEGLIKGTTIRVGDTKSSHVDLVYITFGLVHCEKKFWKFTEGKR